MSASLVASGEIMDIETIVGPKRAVAEMQLSTPRMRYLLIISAALITLIAFETRGKPM